MKQRTTKSPFKNLAAFAESCPTQEEAARRLGIAPSYLSMLLSGQRTPSLSLVQRCADIGIPMDSWQRKHGAAA